MQELDIARDDAIAVYARGEMYGATRVWWALKLYGCTNVRVLQGGIEQYKAEGHPLETGKETWREVNRQRKADAWDFKFDGTTYATMDDVKEALKNKKLGSEVQYIDVRAKERFDAEHTPGA